MQRRPNATPIPERRPSDAAVGEFGEALHRERGPGDVAAESLAADVVSGGDADAARG
jgi:hypothetical protein